MQFQHRVTGYVVGPIWWPVGEECYKGPISRAVDEEETLRDAVLAMLQDGDFQSCELADAVLETTVTVQRGSGTYQRNAVRDLERFASVADLVNTDWSGPAWEE